MAPDDTAKNGATRAAVAEDADPDLTIRPFHQVLAAAWRDSTGLAKGARTRRRLIVSTAEVLERDGIHNMRVTDVCRGAGVSQGTFYLYFGNGTEAALAVLEEFSERCLEMLHVVGPRDRAFDAILESIRALACLYRLNPGLMRCFWQINDEVPEFGELLGKSNAVWHRVVARSIVRRCALSDQHVPTATFVAYALAAMVDQFFVQLYVVRDPQLVALGHCDEQVVEDLSALWYRAAYGTEPPPRRLRTGSMISSLQLRFP